MVVTAPSWQGVLDRVVGHTAQNLCVGGGIIVLVAVAGKYLAAFRLGGDGACRGAPQNHSTGCPCWALQEQPLGLPGLIWVLHQVLSPGATPSQVLHWDPKHGWSSSWEAAAAPRHAPGSGQLCRHMGLHF